jgi:hypothetical protein
VHIESIGVLDHRVGRFGQLQWMGSETTVWQDGVGGTRTLMLAGDEMRVHWVVELRKRLRGNSADPLGADQAAALSPDQAEAAQATYLSWTPAAF